MVISYTDHWPALLDRWQARLEHDHEQHKRDIARAEARVDAALVELRGEGDG